METAPDGKGFCMRIIPAADRQIILHALFRILLVLKRAVILHSPLCEPRGADALVFSPAL